MLMERGLKKKNSAFSVRREIGLEERDLRGFIGSLILDFGFCRSEKNNFMDVFKNTLILLVFFK